MRARYRRALAAHLENLLVHLLKWRYQPARRQIGHSWADSIREARTQLAAARREAGRQTGLPLMTFPEACPWSLEQILAHDFFPEPYGGCPCVL